jgi:hypothetical protein
LRSIQDRSFNARTLWRKDAKEKNHDTPCVFAPSRLGVIERPKIIEREDAMTQGRKGEKS